MSETTRILGLMSGTSVDGIDAALVVFEGQGATLRWRLEHFVCLPWPPALRAAILDACRPDAPLAFITALNFRLGEAFADAAIQAASGAGVALSEIACIASHGQTVWHQATPVEIAGQAVTGTLQLGEPAVIAARTGRPVIADFRPADMALGGQGAPLVPFADFALFRSEHEARILLNLGGIANLTYLPAGCALSDVIAFDSGPGNLLLDALTRHLSGGNREYDAGGEWAAQGQADAALLEMFLNDPYFALPPPKSTGREQFGQAYAERFLRAAQTQNLAPADTLATAAHLTAVTVGEAVRRWLPTRGAGAEMIASGGGTRNQTLMRWLAEQTAPLRLTMTDDHGLPSDAKEAVAFALLAYETLHARPSNVPAATGARGPAILGKMAFPPDARGSWRVVRGA